MASDAPKQPASKAPTLVVLIGVATAGILVPLTQHWEGKRNTAYRDQVNVLTICYGDTNNVVRGETDSDAQCLSRLDTQLAAHAQPVLTCTPILKGHPNQLAAAIDLAYNIGGSAYCGSTVAKRFNGPRWGDACQGFLAWSYAGGKQIPGLLARRKDERALCMKELPQ